MSVASGDRGQTLHDFAIGMTIFLLVLGYVFAFIPSMFAPFTPHTSSSPVRADRTADFLTRDLLAENDTAPGVLNVTCIEDFFNTTYNVPDCGFGSKNIPNLTGLPSRTSVNVSMWREGTVRTHNNTRLARGPSPEGADPRVTRSARIVKFDGRDFRFMVRIW